MHSHAAFCTCAQTHNCKHPNAFSRHTPTHLPTHHTAISAVGGVGATVLRRGLRWSVETETHHTYKNVDQIIDEKKIFDNLEGTLIDI